MTREEFDEILEQTNSVICNREWYERAIKALDQEPKTGHWIVKPSNKEQGERDFMWWECSECGQMIFSETEEDRKKFHAFCGRCGAKMEV